MVVNREPRLFTVPDFERMAESGIFGPGDHVELINGVVLEMTPMGSPHAAHVARLVDLLAPALSGRAIVWVQSPIRASDLSMPEPDVSLVKPADDYYASGHPRPDQVHLVIEVADSSLGFDRTVKAALYAAAGIPEYWLVDIAAGRVEVRRAPTPQGYAEMAVHAGDGALAPVAFPEDPFPLEAILGPGPIPAE